MPGVVFFGSPEFAVPSLATLAEDPVFRPVLAVTQPDRPVGRGRKHRPTAVRSAAEGMGIPVMTLESFDDGDAVGRLESTGAEVFVVAAFGLIFPRRVLAIPSIDCINVHASLLPAWRGASPVNMSLAAGDLFTGVSIMRMVKALDSGPVYAQRAVPIGPFDDAGKLSNDLASAGAELLLSTLDRVCTGGLEPVEQREEGVSYAPLLKKGDGAVPWRKDAVSVHNHIRGMNPWPGSHTMHRCGRLKIHRAEPVDMIDRGARAGTVLRADCDSLEVACGRGTVRLLEVQAEGRKQMPCEEFLRGTDLREGDILKGEG